MVFLGEFHRSTIDLRLFRIETTDIGRFFRLKWTTVVSSIESDWRGGLPARIDGNRKSSFSCRWKWWFEVSTFPSGCSAESSPKSAEFRHFLSVLNYPSNNKRFVRSELSSDKFYFAERWAKNINSMRCEDLGRRTSKYASRANLNEVAHVKSKFVFVQIRFRMAEVLGHLIIDRADDTQDVMQMTGRLVIDLFAWPSSDSDDHRIRLKRIRLMKIVSSRGSLTKFMLFVRISPPNLKLMSRAMFKATLGKISSSEMVLRRTI